MNKKIGLIGGALALCIALILMVNSCGGDRSSDPWAALNPYDDAKLAGNVEAYYDATMGYQSEENAVFDVYTEMSMDFGYMAYQMPENKEFAGDIFLELGKIHHYLIETFVPFICF